MNLTKRIIFYILFTTFIFVVSNTAHELTHQYNPTKIKEICVLGYVGGEAVMEGGMAWVKAPEYWHDTELVPTIVTFVTATLVGVSLMLLYFKDMYGGNNGI